MNTFKSLIAAAATLALLSGMATPVDAQEKLVSFITGQTDPFDKSNAQCETNDNLSCAVLQSHVTKVYTLGEFIAMHKSRSLAGILAANDWTDDEVTLDTVIPKGKQFALRTKT